MPNTEILQKADDLLDAVEELTAKVARNRRTLTVLVAAVVVMVAALLGTGYALVRVSSTARDVQVVNQTSARNLCLSRNESAAKVTDVWETFLGLAAPHPTPEVTAKLEVFRRKLADTYVQRDCNRPTAIVNR